MKSTEALSIWGVSRWETFVYCMLEKEVKCDFKTFINPRPIQTLNLLLKDKAGVLLNLSHCCQIP